MHLSTLLRRLYSIVCPMLPTECSVTDSGTESTTPDVCSGCIFKQHLLACWRVVELTLLYTVLVVMVLYTLIMLGERESPGLARVIHSQCLVPALTKCCLVLSVTDSPGGAGSCVLWVEADIAIAWSCACLPCASTRVPQSLQWPESPAQWVKQPSKWHTISWELPRLRCHRHRVLSHLWGFLSLSHRLCLILLPRISCCRVRQPLFKLKNSGSAVIIIVSQLKERHVSLISVILSNYNWKQSI